MTKSVRYPDGQFYVHQGAWFVRYRLRMRQEDGSTRFQQKAKKLVSVADYPLAFFRDTHSLSKSCWDDGRWLAQTR
jgi:hypothetical protein